MTYQRTFGDEHLKVVDKPGCKFLRSKAMFVSGRVDPVSSDGRESHDDYCWCNLTAHIIGPDQHEARRSECVEGRECYCPR